MSFGSNGIDEGIQSIGTAYDAAGRLATATSYTDAGATDVANQVQLTYNGLWQIAKVEQDVDSAIDGSGEMTTDTSMSG